jgi:monoamine oxidase
MTRRRPVDVLIIGAGAAGLAAARELSMAHINTTIIEARDRIGGRILTVHDPGSPVPIELGAEFVHGEAAETFDIVRAAGLMVNQLHNEHYVRRDGKLAPAEDLWGQAGKVWADVMKKSRRRDFSFREYLNRAKLSPQIHQLVLNFVEGFYAAHAERISARSLASDGDQSGNKQFRILSGYDSVVNWLRAGLASDRVDIRLNTVATDLHWKHGHVELRCGNREGVSLEPFHARAALVTIPHALLKAQSLRFHPQLEEKEKAVARLEVGQVFKIALRFRRGFWEEKNGAKASEKAGVNGMEFLHAHDEAIPVWWTQLPVRAPVLVGWAGGPKADSLLAEDEPTRVQRSLAALANAFEAPRELLDELLESWAMHDWQADPFSRGAYTYVGVGGLSAPKDLAKPVRNTLFFAGEATDLDQIGTVAGAIASGRRAANELLRALKKSRIRA